MIIQELSGENPCGLYNSKKENKQWAGNLPV
jgi:hypothetical protein